MGPGSGPDSRIELDLESSPSALEPRRTRPQVEQLSYERPKLEPVLQDGDLGSDETERTVGILLLVSLLPELLSIMMGHGTASLVNLVLPSILAWGLIQGEEWARVYILWGCVAQLVLAPALAFAMPHASLAVVASLLRNGGLVVLVAGRSLSRPAYFAALGVLGVGVLLGLAGSLLP